MLSYDNNGNRLWIVYRMDGGKHRALPNMFCFAIPQDKSMLDPFHKETKREFNPNLDYKSAKDFIKWCKYQMKFPNYYTLNKGFGLIDGDNRRRFDCTGLFKCFIWEDYGINPINKYKAADDTYAESWLNKVMGTGKRGIDWGYINKDKIPETEGIALWQDGARYEHIGYYCLNGLVIETTASWNKQIMFTDINSPGNDVQDRNSWTHWFKLPQLNYPKIDEPKPEIDYEAIIKDLNQRLEKMVSLNNDLNQENKLLTNALKDVSKVSTSLNNIVNTFLN